MDVSGFRADLAKGVADAFECLGVDAIVAGCLASRDRGRVANVRQEAGCRILTAHRVSGGENVLEPLPIMDLAIALEVPQQPAGDTTQFASTQLRVCLDPGNPTGCFETGNFREHPAPSIELASLAVDRGELGLNRGATLLKSLKCARKPRIFGLCGADEGSAWGRLARHREVRLPDA